MKPTTRCLNSAAVSSVTGERGESELVMSEVLRFLGRKGGSCLIPRRWAIVLVTAARSGSGRREVPSERVIPSGEEDRGPLAGQE